MSEPERPARPAPDPFPPPPAPASADAWTSAPVEPERRPRRPAVLVAAIVALALVAGAGTYLFLRSGEPQATGPATALRLAFDRGDETTYDIHLSMDGSMDLGPLGEQPVKLDVNETVGWKVLRVDDDGVATVRISVSGVSGSANGMPLPADAAEQSSTVRVTSNGQIVDAAGLSFGATGGSGFGSFPGMDQVTPILPDHDVAPGDSWDKRFSQKFPFGDGKIEYTAHSTFDRYEGVNGVRAAVVKTSYEVPLDFSIDLADLAKAFGGSDGGDLPGLGGKDATIEYGGSGTFSQTSWLDIEARQVLKTTSDGDFDMTISFPGLGAEVGTDELALSGTFSMQMTRR